MSRPNILIFCTDEQRADHLSCAGHPHLRTPNIDRIAADGTRFGSCYSSSPVCMPARGTMLTGLTRRATGMRVQGIPVPKHLPTLPGLLAKVGYRTHAVGKLHHQNWGGRTVEPGEDISVNPERRIYWDWPGHWKGQHYTKFPGDYYGYQTLDVANGHVNYIYGDYVTWLESNHPGAYAGYRYNAANPAPLTIDPELHYNRWIADRTIDFIQRHRAGHANDDQPFYVWCSFPDPHEPFAAVRKWAEVYKDVPIDLPGHTLSLSPGNRSTTMQQAGLGTKPYDPDWTRECIRQTYGMISHVDEQIGRVLDAIETGGIADNTVVVFISDHGDQLGEHGLFYKSIYPYDAHARVPFLVRAPGGARGRVVDDVVSMLDLVPTVLDLAGVTYDRPDRPGSALPGEILTPVLHGERAPSRKSALIELDADNVGSLPLVQYRSFVTNEWKLVHYLPTDETLLFDRANDPHELTNLAARDAYADLLRELREALESEWARTGA